jgi:hypothetical protein
VNEEVDGMNKVRKEQGYILVMVAVGLLVIMGFGAFSVDLGFLYHKRGQLQKAADLGALAGATAMVSFGSDEDQIKSVALQYARANLQANDEPSLAVIESDITFPNPDQIEVIVHRTQGHGNPVRLFLGPALGRNWSDVTATARAAVRRVCGNENCVLPISVPDKFEWDDYCDTKNKNIGNNILDVDSECEVASVRLLGYTPDDMGMQVTIKIGDPQNAISPGIFAPVTLPPVNKGTPETGANAYREHFTNPCDPRYSVGPNDELLVEPGNMIGQSKQGFDHLIDPDPYAYWDTETNSIKGSNAPNPMDSSRVQKMAFFDPTRPPTSGRNTIFVSQIGTIFIESIDNKGNVTARYIDKAPATDPGQTGEDCLLSSISLIRDSSR